MLSLVGVRISSSPAIVATSSPKSTIKAYLLVIEPFDFDADFLSHTSNQAFLQSVFDCWQILPLARRSAQPLRSEP